MNAATTFLAPRWRLHLPDPGRGWVRYVPAVWPTAESWTDVPAERWGSGGGRGCFPGEPENPVEDVLWLPPVPAGRVAERDTWAAARAGEGTPVVVQVFPGESTPAGCIPAYDLCDAVLGKRPLRAADLGPNDPARMAVWPVLPGLAPGPDERGELLATLAAAGISALLVVRPELRPADLRLLVNQVGEERHAAAFHGRAGSRREIARQARALGLEPFPPRPSLARAHLPEGNREVAAAFGLLGELWTRLGLPAEPAQSFFSAMRALDRFPHSLARLREEGNLGVIPWLDEARRAIVEDVLSTGRSSLAEDLLDRYAGERPR